MPTNVQRFEILMFLSIGLSVPIALLNPDVMVQLKKGLAGPLMTVAILAVFILLILAASRWRQNWARWVVVIFFVLGLLPFIFYLSDYFSQSIIGGSLSSAQFVLQSAALYFIFTGNARDWFRRT